MSVVSSVGSTSTGAAVFNKANQQQKAVAEKLLQPVAEAPKPNPNPPKAGKLSTYA